MNKAKILIVDDDPATLDVGRRILVKAGYDVAVAEDWHKGLARARAEHFDLVYADLLLPEFDGVMLCRAIKQACPSTEVVLISSSVYEMGKKAQSFREAGGKELLRKPFSYDELTVLTDVLLERHGLAPGNAA